MLPPLLGAIVPTLTPCGSCRSPIPSPKRTRDRSVGAGEVSDADVVLPAGKVEPPLLDALEAKASRLVACCGACRAMATSDHSGCRARPARMTKVWALISEVNVTVSIRNPVAEFAYRTPA